MGKFQELPEDLRMGRRGFQYVDQDGDRVTVWRWKEGPAHIRFTASAQGADVDGDDFDEFFRRLRELLKGPCSKCDGSGIS